MANAIIKPLLDSSVFLNNLFPPWYLPIYCYYFYRLFLKVLEFRSSLVLTHWVHASDISCRYTALIQQKTMLTSLFILLSQPQKQQNKTLRELSFLVCERKGMTGKFNIFCHFFPSERSSPAPSQRILTISQARKE